MLAGLGLSEVFAEVGWKLIILFYVFLDELSALN